MATELDYNKAFVDKVIALMAGQSKMAIDDTLRAELSLNERLELSKRGYIVRHENKIPVEITNMNSGSEAVGSTVKSAKAEEVKIEVRYIEPGFSTEVEALLKCVTEWTKYRSVNLRFVGPHGSGKTEYAHLVAKKVGADKVYQINGRFNMDPSAFVGEKTVTVDEKSGQNYVSWEKGTLELAMTHGLKKDENGNAVLDKDGNVEVVGAPAVLFIDEYAAIPAHISILLNRILEIPSAGQSRRIDIMENSCRAVHGHPGLAVMLGGNVLGKGCESSKTAGYTAQDIQQDDSTLDRITATFIFGYSKRAEAMYIRDAVKDTRMVEGFVKFLENIRMQWKQEKVLTLMSTRAVVNVCTAVKLYDGVKGLPHNPLAYALHRAVFSGLREVEMDAWAECININLGFDIRVINKREEKDVFYI